MSERCRHDVAQDCPACAEDTIAKLVKALEDIAEFGGADASTIGAINTLARIQRKARDAIAAVKGAPDHG